MAGKTVLGIFAHADDEVPCVGTLASHSLVHGDDVHLVYLTRGENSTILDGDPEEKTDTRAAHLEKLADVLQASISVLYFPDSEVEYSTSNGYRVAEVIREIKPDILITWNQSQRLGSGHPDHVKCSKLVTDAVRYARYNHEASQFPPYRKRFSFYQYFEPVDDGAAQFRLVDVTDQIDIVEQVLAIYEEIYGDWPARHSTYAKLQYFGRLAGVEYAEAFKLIHRGYEIPTSLQ